MSTIGNWYMRWKNSLPTPKIMTMQRRQMLRNLKRMLNIDYADTNCEP